MRSTKLIRQLSLLNKKDIKSFLRFAHSPYHNTIKLLPSLLEEIVRYYPDFKHPNLEVKKIYQRIHPKGKAWHEGRMNLLMTQLLTLLDDFRTFEVFKNDQFNVQRAKIQSYQDYQLDRSFFRATKGYQELLEKLPKDENYYLQSFLHYEKVYQYLEKKKNKASIVVFKKCLDSLNQSFLWYSTVFSLAVKNRMRVLNVELTFPLLEPYFSDFEEVIKKDVLLLFHRGLLKLQDTKDEALLVELIGQFHEVMPLLTTKKRIEVMQILLNTLMSKLRDGAIHLKDKLFDLYKIREQNDLLISNNRIESNTFINVVASAAACGHFQWSDDFMKNYESKIYEEQKEDTLKLAEAYKFYYKGVQEKNKSDFIEVIERLNRIQFIGDFFFYRVKTLLLRTHYECIVIEEGDSEFVLNQISAFEQQIRRKKEIIGNKFESFSNFTKAFKKLIEIKNKYPFNKNELSNFREQLSKKEQLFSKTWLLEKIGELEKPPD